MTFVRLVMACGLSWAMTSGSAHAFFFKKNEGMKEDCPKEYSKALCVLKAAEVSSTYEDLTVKSAGAMIKREGAELNDSWVDLVGIGATMGGSKPAPGMSKGGEIGMILLGMLLQTKPEFVGRNMVLGWMPKELASSAEEARTVMQKELLGATFRAFNGYELSPMSRAGFRGDGKYDTESKGDMFGLSVKGEGCGPGECMLMQYRIPFYGAYVLGVAPVEGEAPKWMGGYKAWVFGQGSSPELLDFMVRGESRTHTVAGKISKELPGWMFVSVTPQYNGDDRGPMSKGSYIPLVYSEGKPMTTVFPEVDLEALAKRKKEKEQ